MGNCRLIDWKKIERWFVFLVAIHSYGVGVFLSFFPAKAAAFTGWGRTAYPLFFVVQGGVFHFVVATGYLHEYLRHRSMFLLVSAKTTAFLFLLAASLIWREAWSLPFVALSDGAMAAAGCYISRKASV